MSSRWTQHRAGDQGIQQEKKAVLERAGSQVCDRGCSLLKVIIFNECHTAGQMPQPYSYTCPDICHAALVSEHDSKAHHVFLIKLKPASYLTSVSSFHKYLELQNMYSNFTSTRSPQPRSPRPLLRNFFPHGGPNHSSFWI